MSRSHAALGGTAEAIGVTFLMDGGPATVYGPRAYAAFRESYDQRDGHPQPAVPPDGHQHAH